MRDCGSRPAPSDSRTGARLKTLYLRGIRGESPLSTSLLFHLPASSIKFKVVLAVECQSQYSIIWIRFGFQMLVRLNGGLDGQP